MSFLNRSPLKRAFVPRDPLMQQRRGQHPLIAFAKVTKGCQINSRLVMPSPPFYKTHIPFARNLYKYGAKLIYLLYNRYIPFAASSRYARSNE